jgi:hypothetical protein
MEVLGDQEAVDLVRRSYFALLKWVNFVVDVQLYVQIVDINLSFDSSHSVISTLPLSNCPDLTSVTLSVSS